MRIFARSLLMLVIVAFGCNQQQPKRIVSSEGLKIEYIAHACFILESNGTRIMLDPYADHVWLGYDFPKDITVDAVFITHPHYDHDGGLFRGLSPYWMCEAPFYQNPREYEVGPFKVSGIIGKHAGPYGKEFRQMNTIWKIEVEGLTLAHWGDNAPLTPENKKALKGTDVLLIPMDGDFHIIPKEAYKDALDAIQPPLIIPMHYRIAALEKDENSPSDLGEIAPFLEVRPEVLLSDSTAYLPDVHYLETNITTITSDDLPEKSEYLVFQHSPLVKRAD